MNKISITFLLFSFFLVGCGHDHEKQAEEVNFLDPIEVELVTVTELKVNQEIVTQAIVRQGDMLVTDVNEVIFEVWQHGNPESYRSVEGLDKGEGVYEVSWTANDEGVYYIYYHVTARGMHRMEKHQFVIGDVDVEKILATPDERPKKHMH
ncbi:hypothetical protein DS745_18330 [Anaerobacillus alkaliphilus]|uniref:YtkA-like domain-containing protein n=1 Tax=Anaerobacillus alkaliphilus TaxID=1548597 RepID=A0A4Q0VS93_9BACI|nr:FixH family protein [Anaerobacillus alkaliphilus]RXI98290.1 hypothetical protein DS745_18330 [Anaerobacillus alkaliphilus]